MRSATCPDSRLKTRAPRQRVREALTRVLDPEPHGRITLLVQVNEECTLPLGPRGSEAYGERGF